MHKQLATTLTLLVACGAAWARIGETEVQITARYGQSIGDIPTEAFGSVRGFAFAGISRGGEVCEWH